MPTNNQRATALVTTAVIVFGGAGIASMAKDTRASGGELAHNSSAQKVVTVEKEGWPLTDSSFAGGSDTFLSITLNGVRNAKGKLYVMVFDNADAFASYDYERAVDIAVLPAVTESVVTKFPQLSERAFAVVVFHDENNNQQFDIRDEYPVEGYGTSNAINAYETLNFHEARIRPGPISIEMFYWD